MTARRTKTSRMRGVLAGLVLVAASASIAGCSRHDVALTRPCPTGSGLRATTLPKIGLTPAELKLQEKCD
jgi:hypothetical protein